MTLIGSVNVKSVDDVINSVNPEQDDLAERKWNNVKKRLRETLGEEIYSSWFARMSIENWSNGLIHLSVPTKFLKSWITSHYKDQLHQLLNSEYPVVKRIDISVRDTNRTGVKTNNSGADITQAAIKGDNNTATTTGNNSAINGISKDILSQSNDKYANNNFQAVNSQLDQRLNFSTFFVNRTNALAHAASNQIATARHDEPVTFNPLFIHATVGLGKTHLLQAIAWEAQRLSPAKKILYLTTERFMYGFAAALQNHSALAFKERMREIDLLLIDDMQFLQGKSTQQEFCHTLNSMIESAKQVVITADRPPVDLNSLDDRVKSRLSGGLVVEVGPLNWETRRAIVQQRLKISQERYKNLSIPDAVIDFVAQHITASGRDLEGAVNRLVATNQLTGNAVTIEAAEQALQDLIRSKEPNRIRIEDIQKTIAKHYNVSKADLLSSRRARVIVRPRQIAMYLSKQLTPRSLPEIGRHFGGRDHTTVLHAVRKVEELRAKDSLLNQEVDHLKRLLES